MWPCATSGLHDTQLGSTHFFFRRLLSIHGNHFLTLGYLLNFGTAVFEFGYETLRDDTLCGSFGCRYCRGSSFAWYRADRSAPVISAVVGCSGRPTPSTEGVNPKSHNAKHGGGDSRRKNGGAGCLKIKKIPRVFANFLKRIGQLTVFFRQRSSVAYRRSLPKRIFDICAFFIRFTKLTTCFLF